MSSFLTYQEIDSSDVKINGNNLHNELELIEEVDELVELPQPKKYFQKKITDTTRTDTFYGIKNENLIPIRKTKNVVRNTEEVKEKLFNPTPINSVITNWQVIVLLTVVLLLGVVKAFSNNRFKQSIKALFNYSVALEITREEKVFFHRGNILLTIIHIVTIALFLYQIKELFNVSWFTNDGILYFLIFAGAIIVSYFVKYVFSKFMFFVLDDVSIASEYVFNVSLFNNLLGVVFLPILCISYFSSISFPIILFYVVIPLTLLIFALRLIRLYVIGLTKGISYFYIFLYICTLEILPLVVLYRIFIL